MNKSLTHTERALQVLRAANQALENNSEEQALLESICRIAIEVGGYRFSWVGFALDDEEKSIQFVASAGYHSDYLKEIRVGWGDNSIGQGPAGIAIRTATAYVLRDAHNNPDFEPWREKARKYGYESAIALPLIWREQSFGCLTILSAEPDSFDNAEASLLGELAASLSYGISALRANLQRDQSEIELRTERDTQEVLRKILSLSLEKIPLEEKLDRVLELLFNIPWLALERKGSVFLVEENKNTLILAAKKYLAPVLQNKCANVAFGHCLCGRAAVSKKLVFHNHVNQDHETRFEGMPDHGHYCQPILSAQGLVGVLNLYIAAGHVPKPIEAPFLSSVADTLASLIELEQAKVAQQRLVTILDATPDLVTITDPEGLFLYCNDGAKNMFACSHEPCTQSVRSSYPEDVARLLLEEAYPNAVKAGMWEGDITLNLPDGGQLPVSQLVMAHRDVPGGEIVYFSTVGRDISDRKHAEIAAQKAALHEKNFANTLINSLPGIFYLINEIGRLMRWNRNFEQALGYTRKQLSNMKLQQLVTDEDQPLIEKFLDDTRASGTSSVEVYLLNSDDSRIPFFINGVRIANSETGESMVGTGIDISYRHQLENELRALATTDALTGAFNRRKMEQEIEHEIQKSLRNSTPLSIAMFDIDHFKRVNDTFGHDAGDIVLKKVVELVRKQLRDTDIIARWGGEEFIILSSTTPLRGMQVLAERVRTTIADHNINRVGHITISLGIAEYQSNEGQESLLKRADDALYLAKKSGRNQTKMAEPAK